jgi:type VI secretion system protein VasJ
MYALLAILATRRQKRNADCGLGRDSSDSIGCPYPLLIMGEGRLKGWEKRWSQLPVQLNRTWKRMESIVT